MKTKFLIASHGNLAKGFQSSLDILADKGKELAVINAYVTPEDYTPIIQTFLQSLGTEEQAIILTDLYGGSVNQKIVQEVMTTKPDNVFIISNANLAIALSLIFLKEGEKLTKSQLKYHNKTKLRDIALLTLLLGTGIRVSECVGLDIADVDFKNNGIKIRRKGGYETVIYFGGEVADALYDYLEKRYHVIPLEGHENALFLSMQNRRITVRAVENLVKKYASNVTGLKKITPHKLRSTYGTALYQETGDIYLVADVLGHKDVNTTRKHYAALEDSRRRMAAKAVHLREK